MALPLLLNNVTDRYGAACSELLAAAESFEFGPGRPVAELKDHLTQLDHAALGAGRQLVDAAMADCCLSGLWLLFNYLDYSHELSQNIETTTGSYWHGIMHRREPDYDNAKYWFRRVRRHPIFVLLAAEVVKWSTGTHFSAETARLTANSNWDPFAHVDLCELAAHRKPELAEVCRHIGWLEWQLLFDYSYTQAFSA